jgi:hypothetical protein
MSLKIGQIVGLSIGLLILAIMLPIGLTDLIAFTSTDSNVQTIVTTVIPIVAVIGIVLALIPRGKGSD